jgi:hypothetical protein
MIPPFFLVCADGDILVFRSLDEAESYMESPDVEAGEYVAGFDRTGTRLTIAVVEPTKHGRVLGIIPTLQLTRVLLREGSEPGAAADELRSLLASRLGMPDEPSLAVLVQRAEAAPSLPRR